MCVLVSEKEVCGRKESREKAARKPSKHSKNTQKTLKNQQKIEKKTRRERGRETDPKRMNKRMIAVRREPREAGESMPIMAKAMLEKAARKTLKKHSKNTQKTLKNQQKIEKKTWRARGRETDPKRMNKRMIAVRREPREAGESMPIMAKAMLKKAARKTLKKHSKNTQKNTQKPSKDREKNVESERERDRPEEDEQEDNSCEKRAARGRREHSHHGKSNA